MILEQGELFGEQWRPIPGAPDYEASSRGRIRRSRSGRGARVGRVLAPFWGGGRSGGQYLQVELYRRTRYVHRLVALAWCEGASPELDVDHVDRDRSNNRPDNLRWVPGGYNGYRANMGRWHGTDPDFETDWGPASSSDSLPY